MKCNNTTRPLLNRYPISFQRCPKPEKSKFTQSNAAFYFSLVAITSGRESVCEKLSQQMSLDIYKTLTHYLVH